MAEDQQKDIQEEELAPGTEEVLQAQQNPEEEAADSAVADADPEAAEPETEGASEPTAPDEQVANEESTSEEASDKEMPIEQAEQPSDEVTPESSEDAPVEVAEAAAEEVTEKAAPEEAPVDAAEAGTEESAPEEAPVDAAEAVTEESAPEEAPVDAAEAVTEESPTEEAPVEAAEAVTEESATEEAQVEAAEAATEESATEEVDASPTEEIEAIGSVELAPGMIGYTGEISGEVYKLEDLDKVTDPEDWNVGLDDLRKLVENTLTNVSEHEIVAGKVVSVGEKDVVIDIGFKSDGIVSRSEFDSELTEGEEVEVYLERIEDYHGQLVLSKTKADTVRRWRRIEDAFNNEEVLEGTIIRRIKGGMIVDLFDGMEAFLPGSQIDVRPVRDFDAYLEKRMEFKIVKLNPANENIVVSHKALIEKDLMAQRENILSTMEPGQILEGLVKNITDFGVFIDLGGVDGLLHITDLSWGRVSHPSELVSLDEKLNVVVLDYDKERQRISLGLKQLQKHPWEDIEEKLSGDQLVEGKVVSITDYGAFVELEKGIEGLVHISEMSWTEHIRHPSQMVSLGQVVSVKILKVDSEGKKISLGMKQLEPDPWENIAERYPPGTVMRGKVRNITNFGVFVEIEPGIDGLVHISDLSWTKRISHPSDMVKKGQELDVVVLNIDTSERRISLGHKQVDTNPWNQFAQVYAEGSTSGAKVVRIEDKGLVVELPLEVEAFLPDGELPEGQSMADFKPGDEIADLFVIRFDVNQKEIILSATEQARSQERAERRAEKRDKAVARADEKRDVKKFIQKETAGGAATLGELSGLAELKAKMEQSEVVVGDEEVPVEESSADAEPVAEEASADAAAVEEAPAEDVAVEEVAPVVEDTPAEEETLVVEDAPSEEAVADMAEAPSEEDAVSEDPEMPKPKAKAPKKAAKKSTTKAKPKAKAKPKPKSKTKAKATAKDKEDAAESASEDTEETPSEDAGEES